MSRCHPERSCACWHSKAKLGKRRDLFSFRSKHSQRLLRAPDGIPYVDRELHRQPCSPLAPYTGSTAGIAPCRGFGTSRLRDSAESPQDGSAARTRAAARGGALQQRGALSKREREGRESRERGLGDRLGGICTTVPHIAGELRLNHVD